MTTLPHNQSSKDEETITVLDKVWLHKVTPTEALALIQSEKLKGQIAELEKLLSDEDRHDDSPMIRSYVLNRISELQAQLEGKENY